MMSSCFLLVLAQFQGKIFLEDLIFFCFFFFINRRVMIFFVFRLFGLLPIHVSYVTFFLFFLLFFFVAQLIIKSAVLGKIWTILINFCISQGYYYKQSIHLYQYLNYI